VPIKSEKQVLLEQFGVVIKKLILDDREDSEDYDEIIESIVALTRVSRKLYLSQLQSEVMT